MNVLCSCGSRIRVREERCVKCGGTCCSACAFALSSDTFCARCAESMLDAEGLSLRLGGR